MRRVPIALLCAPIFGQCIQVDSEQIRARDLAPVIEVFRSIDPEAVVGFTPAPSVRRLIPVRELAWMAVSAGVEPTSLPQKAVCIERLTRDLPRDEIVSAMEASFPEREATIDILDSSHYAVPSGRLVFERSGLNAPPLTSPNAPVIWRGRVIYDGNRSTQVWARVRISTKRVACVAAVDIPAGKPIQADQVRLVELLRFPFPANKMIESIDEVTGNVARRPIHSGQEIVSTMLRKLPEVRAGDTVHVSALAGRAHISLDATAASSGRKGDTILLQNPSSHTRFKAIVSGTGQASITGGQS